MISKEKFFEALGNLIKEEHVENTFVFMLNDDASTQPVTFDYLDGLRLKKTQLKEFNEEMEWYFDNIADDFKDAKVISEEDTIGKEYMDYLDDFTVKEALALRNEEQKRAALSIFTSDQILEDGELTLIGEETITKTQPRWTVGEKGMQKEDVTFDDTYQLYKGEVSLGRGFTNVFGIVKCKDTSTDRDYHLYVDIAEERDSNNQVTKTIEDPIAAIASTFRLAVPNDTYSIRDIYEAIYRQGDVLMGKIKEEFLDAKLTIDKALTREEYIDLIVTES